MCALQSRGTGDGYQAPGREGLTERSLPQEFWKLPPPSKLPSPGRAQAPEARNVVPTLAPKMPKVNILVVLLSSHLLGHAAPSRGNTGGAQHLRK